MTSHMFVAGDEIVVYTIIRTNRKSLEIRVNKDATVTIRAPTRMPYQEIANIVTKKTNWIQKHRDNFKGDVVNTSRSFAQGGLHPFLGKGYTLDVSEGPVNDLVLEGDRMRVRTKDSSEEYVEGIVYQWYREQAKDIFHGILHRRFSEMTDQLAGEPPELKLRRMRRKWGTCQPEKRIVTLNTELIRAHHDQIDYVIVHELCHLKFRKHDVRFYGMLSQYYPDWKTKKKMLNRIML